VQEKSHRGSKGEKNKMSIPFSNLNRLTCDQFIGKESAKGRNQTHGSDATFG
jgi:hypothetical protein